jgi:hypothetical protein
LDSFFCLASASCTGSGGQFFRLQDGVFFGSPTVADPTTSQWVSATFTPGINVDSGTFHGVFAVPAGMSTDSLDAYLHILAASDTVDFTHTGALSFGNLNGVTFTSASGVLLAQAPEPGSWILIAAGLGLLGLATCAKAYTSHAV